MTFIFYCYTSFHTEVACVIFLVLLGVFVTFRTEPDQLCPRVFSLCALLTCRTRIIFKRQSREPYLLISLRENECGIKGSCEVVVLKILDRARLHADIEQ